MTNRRVALAVAPVVAALLLASAGPGLAQTTSATTQNPVAADAGSALFVLRALPGASLPGFSSGNGALEAALGLTAVTADSTRPRGQMSTATATPLGLTLGDTDTAAQNPAQLSQGAAPDNAQPATSGFAFPTQLAPLLSGGLLDGSVQARWSDTLGPCVSPISTATTSLASVSAITSIPSLGGASGTSSPLSGLTDLLGSSGSGLGSLTGLLDGTGTGASVVTLPSTSSTTSTTQLVDVPGQSGKGVQATTTVQLADLQLFAGSPFATAVQVVSQPTLTAISTGSAATSTVTYTSPVLDVTLPGSTTAVRLDAQNPTLDVPLAVALPATLAALPAAQVTAGLTSLLGSVLGAVPTASTPLPSSLDLGVLRLQVGQFQQVTNGASVGGTASLLSLALLPTSALAGALGSGGAALPTSLLQVGLGEQTARAAVGAGGVDCSLPPQTFASVPTSSAVSRPLAYTSGAYVTIPLLWVSAGLLLVGSVMVAGSPRRRAAAA